MKLPGDLNLTAYRGDTWDLVITFTKNDAPHNLTGTAKMKLYKHNAKDPYAEYNLTITDNILSYSFTVANVLSFAMSGRYDITFSENANVKTKIRGSLTVENVQTSGSVVGGATVTLTETNLIAQVTEGIPGPKGEGIGDHKELGINDHDDVNTGDKTEGRGLLFDADCNLVESSDTLATSQEVNDKASLSPFIRANIRDFGAVGDGESDDLQPILDAIDSLPDGGILYIPETDNEFCVSGKIVIEKSIRIIGNGYNSALKAIPENVEFGLETGLITVRSNNVIIENIRIDGNNDAIPPYGAQRNSGIYIDKVDFCEVNSVFLHNTPRHGLTVTGKYNKVNDIRIWDTATHNISFGAGNNETDVTYHCIANNIWCLGGPEGAVEINDGVHYLIMNNIHIEGSFGDAPLRIIDHGREGESNSDIIINNMTIISKDSTGAGRRGIFVATNDSGGLIEPTKHKNIKFSNCYIKCETKGISIRGNIENISFENIDIETPDRSVLIADVHNKVPKFVNFKNINILNLGSEITVSTTEDLIFENYTFTNVNFISDEDVISGGQNISFNKIKGLIAENIVVKRPSSQNRRVFRIRDCKNVKLINCIADCTLPVGSDSSGNGFEIDNCKNVELLNCIARNNPFMGLDVLSNCENIKIIGGHYSHNGRFGIRIVEVDNVLLSGVEAKNNNSLEISGYAIQLRVNDKSIKRNIITGCNFYDDQDTQTQDSALNFRMTSGDIDGLIITSNTFFGGIDGDAIPENAIFDNNFIES